MWVQAREPSEIASGLETGRATDIDRLLVDTPRTGAAEPVTPGSCAACQRELVRRGLVVFTCPEEQGARLGADTLTAVSRLVGGPATASPRATRIRVLGAFGAI